MSVHETGGPHLTSMNIYLSRKNIAERIDSKLLEQQKTCKQYWEEVLKRALAVIYFLGSRGLPLHSQAVEKEIKCVTRKRNHDD